MGHRRQPVQLPAPGSKQRVQLARTVYNAALAIAVGVISRGLGWLLRRYG